ncbi:MAG: mercury methylation corrinoid protein HgcA, partial [Candidatus Latescibacterota bacterium]
MDEIKSNLPHDQSSEGTCCCSPAASQPNGDPWGRGFQNAPQSITACHWFDGSVLSMSREIPRVKTKLNFGDALGSWKVRWGIGRNTYRIPPGLYAVGSPTPQSPVLVTANYKMSFDKLRSQLAGDNAWILALDTKGINVWCAAGKGTFGTEEIVRRVEQERLAEVVAHRQLILPQLGATGVSAHEVQARSGWRIKYGPIRCEDLKAYFDSAMKANSQMRRIAFPLISRIKLIPVELVMSARYLLIALVSFAALSGLNSQGYSFERFQSVGLKSVLLLLMAYLVGAAA